MLKEDIDKDLKVAMLAGDKSMVSILRSIKSAILYKEVADGKRTEGLTDSEIIAVLKKEHKARQEAFDIYQEAGDSLRAEVEKYQRDVIDHYLPEQMTKEELELIIDKKIKELGLKKLEIKDMGTIIGAVKKQVPEADGSLLAQIVKTIINKGTL